MKLTLLKTTEYTAWYEAQDQATKVIIQARLERLTNHGHFGTVNRFEGITELKWKSGMRIYTAIKLPNVILLLGGNKNGQDKDIRLAKRLLRQIDGT